VDKVGGAWKQGEARVIVIFWGSLHLEYILSKGDVLMQSCVNALVR
jgi:hypothetical protein